MILLRFVFLFAVVLLVCGASASHAQPNLVLSPDDVFPARGDEGCNATVAVVHNYGDAPSGPFTLRFGVADDVTVKTAETVVANLDPGKQQILWSCFYGGNWTSYWATADVHDVVPESNEGDNFWLYNGWTHGMGAGETFLWSIGVPNPGDDMESASLAIVSPGPGWVVTADPAAFTLAPGALQTVTITVQSPDDYDLGRELITATVEFADGSPGIVQCFLSINPGSIKKQPVAVKPSTWGRVKALYRD